MNFWIRLYPGVRHVDIARGVDGHATGTINAVPRGRTQVIRRSLNRHQTPPSNEVVALSLAYTVIENEYNKEKSQARHRSDTSAYHSHDHPPDDMLCGKNENTIPLNKV